MPHPSVIHQDYQPKHVPNHHVVAYHLITDSDIDLDNHLIQPFPELLLPFLSVLLLVCFEFQDQIQHFLEWSDVEIMQSFEKPYLVSFFLLVVMLLCSLSISFRSEERRVGIECWYW